MIPENTNRIKGFGLGEGAAGLLLLLRPIWLGINTLISGRSWHTTGWLPRCYQPGQAAPAPQGGNALRVLPTAATLWLLLSGEEPGYLKPSKPPFLPLSFSKNYRQLPTLQRLCLALCQGGGGDGKCCPGLVLIPARALAFYSVFRSTAHIHARGNAAWTAGSALGRRAGQLTGLFTQSVENIWNT